LALNDSRGYPELLEQAAQIANKSTAVCVFTPKNRLSLLRQLVNVMLDSRFDPSFDKSAIYELH